MHLSLTVFVASPDIRGEQALGVLRLAGPLEHAGIHQIWWDEIVNVSQQIIQADLVVIQRNFAQRRQPYAQIIAAARQADKPVVFEIDDLLWELPAEHPDRQKNVYAEAQLPMLMAATQADAITVASPALQVYFRAFFHNIYLLPNYLNESLWAMRAPRPLSNLPPAKQTTTIGFMGGNSHIPDLEMIVPVLKRLCQRYGSKLILKFWGLTPPAALLSLPNTWCMQDQIIRYGEFAAYLSEQECDIWIAPLRQNLFNKCKSAIKFLEYTTSGAPGVYSQIPPYEGVVVHGETGLLAGSLDEWDLCLTQLIEQPQTRRQIAAQAQEVVRQNWLLADHAIEWEQVYRQIIDLTKGRKKKTTDAMVPSMDTAKNRNAYSIARPIPNALAAILVDQTRPLQLSEGGYPIAAEQQVKIHSVENSSTDLVPHPQVSIILVTYNNMDLTRQCLDSIYNQTDSPTFEIIVVDNASKDDTPYFLMEYISTHPNMKVILNPINEGFARGNNIGAAVALGEYLVFLNNDTVVTRSWLAGLLRHLEDPTVGMVGPVTNFSSNESRIPADYDPSSPDLDGLDAFAEKYTRKHSGRAFEVEMLLLLCVAIRRSVYDQVGGIDERYGIGMFEDEDFSLEIRNKSYKLLCAEDVYIHHWGSASFSKLGLAGYWLTHEENRNKFEEKWGRRWYPQLYRPELQREHVRQLVDGSLYLAKQVIDAEKVYQQLVTKLYESGQTLLERNQTLTEIYSSRGWRLVKFLRRLRLTLIPKSSFRERIACRVFHVYRVIRDEGLGGLFRRLVSKGFHSRLAQRMFSWMISSRMKAFYRAYRHEYLLNDRTRVILYSDPSILPDYSPRRELATPSIGHQTEKVTLISTVRNEAAHAKSWLDSLLQQSRLPDEMVITDGGSTDQTVAIIREFAQLAPFPVQVIEAGRVNVSSGRNIAIQNASHPTIACTDFGCILDQDWLHNLILPFEADPNTQLSAGYYEPLRGTDFQNISGSFFVQDFKTLNPQNFLPSGRSVAMRKSLWKRAGGYPEYLTLSGEDTLFDYQVKQQGGDWAFVPQAKVSWRVVRNFERLADAWFRYARGDGEMGMFAPAYWSKTQQVVWFVFFLLTNVLVSALCVLFFGQWGWLVPAGIVLWAAIRFARTVRLTMISHRLSLGLAVLRVLIQKVIGFYQFKGFFTGVRNRTRVQQRQIEIYSDQLKKIVAEHPECKGVIVFPPTHDWGFMFQRPHQVARAFAQRGYLFFFHVYNLKTDAVVGFQEVEPNLYTSYVPMDSYRVLETPIVYIGSPWHRSTLAYFDRPVIVYDHYDDLAVWNARREDHQYLLENAQVVMTTAKSLLEKAQTIRSDILYAPNGVDYDFIQRFRPDPSEDVPDDLKPILTTGKPIIGYSGAIAEWFDYDLVREAARARPDWAFVLIGVNYDHSLDQSKLLESGLNNLFWLDMKSYDELFRYVWRFDVGIIPFKVNEITQATSPIKLFEYMACGKPVVSTPLPECKNYPGVFIAENSRQFRSQLSSALQARKDEAYLRTIDQVARQNTWGQRIEVVITCLEKAMETQSARIQTAEPVDPTAVGQGKTRD